MDNHPLVPSPCYEAFGFKMSLFCVKITIENFTIKWQEEEKEEEELQSPKKA